MASAAALMFTHNGALAGPNMGFGIPSSANGNARRGAPPNYFDTTMPSAGTSFGLTSSYSSGSKRPALSGGIESEMAAWATESLGSKRRRVGASDVVGYTTAEQDSRNYGENVRTGSSEEIARSFGFSLNMLNKNHFTTIGFVTNPTVPGNETNLVSLPGYETPGEYDLVIMRDQLNSEEQTLKINSADDFFIDTSRKIGFTLSGFNHYIGTLQTDDGPSNPADALFDRIQRANRRRALGSALGSKEALQFFLEGKWDSAEDIWRYFHRSGVVDSETFEGGTSSVTRHEYGMDAANRKRNVNVNLIKYGRANIVGLATPRLPAGTNLFLITKKIIGVDIYRTDTTHELDYDEIMFSKGLRGAVTLEVASGKQQAIMAYRWQVIPWASGKGKARPSDKDLEWYDEFGCKRHGSYDFCGIVNKENNTDPYVDNYTLATNLALARSQTPLDMIYTR